MTQNGNHTETKAISLHVIKTDCIEARSRVGVSNPSMGRRRNRRRTAKRPLWGDPPRWDYTLQVSSVKVYFNKHSKSIEIYYCFRPLFALRKQTFSRGSKHYSFTSYVIYFSSLNIAGGNRRYPERWIDEEMCFRWYLALHSMWMYWWFCQWFIANIFNGCGNKMVVFCMNRGEVISFIVWIRFCRKVLKKTNDWQNVWISPS